MLIPIIRWRRGQPEAHQTQPSRTPDARSGEFSERERAGAFPPRSSEETVHGIAHQVKPDGRLRGAVGGNGVPEKMRMAPCRASIRLPFPTTPGKPGAPRHGRRAGHGVACGELATVSGNSRRATKSAMVPKQQPGGTEEQSQTEGRKSASLFIFLCLTLFLCTPVLFHNFGITWCFPRRCGRAGRNPAESGRRWGDAGESIASSAGGPRMGSARVPLRCSGPAKATGRAPALRRCARGRSTGLCSWHPGPAPTARWRA
jgi:hypothetical protein